MLHRDNRALSAWQVSPKTGLKLREVAAIDRVGLGSHCTCLRQTPPPLIHASHPGRSGDPVIPGTKCADGTVMEYEGDGGVTQKGESSRDQEEDVKPERGEGTGRQGGEKGLEEARWAGEGRERGEEETGKGERTGRKGGERAGRVETDTEANVSPNMGTLKTNLRYSGNWGHWNLQRKQTKITVGREQSTVTLCWSPGSAGAVGERQEEGTDTDGAIRGQEMWGRAHYKLP